MNKQFNLGSVDMMVFLISSLLGIRILRLPRTLAKVAATDSWISVLLGSIIVLALSLMLYWLGLKHPGKNGPEIIVAVYGSFIGKLGIVFILIHNITSMAFALDIYSNSLKLYLLPSTPLYMTAGVMLALAINGFSKGIKTLSTLLNILLPQTLLWMTLLLVLPIKEMEFQDLLPFMSNGIKPVLIGALEVVDALYGFTIIAYIMPYFKDMKKAFKWIFPGVFIATTVYMGVIIAILMVYGADETVRLVYPTLNLAKSVELDFNIIERAESVFMITWTITTFIILMLTFLVSYKNLKVLFPKKDKILIFGQLPFIWFIMNIAKNTAQVNLYTQYVNYLGRVLILGILPITFVVVLIKERMKKSEA